MLNYWKFYG